MKHKLAAIVLMAMVYSANATAEFVTLSNFTLWSNTYANAQIRLSDVGVPINPSGCTDLDSYMVLSSLSAEIKNRIYSTLLSAKAMNRPVKLWVEGCESNRPAILTVIIS